MKRLVAVVVVLVVAVTLLGCGASREPSTATMPPLVDVTPTLVTVATTTSTVPPAIGQCAQWYTTAIAAGWPPELWLTVDRIMWAESRCVPDAWNPVRVGEYGNARGLMQVLDELWAPECGITPDDLYDPYLNLVCALYVFNRQGFEAWSTY